VHHDDHRGTTPISVPASTLGSHREQSNRGRASTTTGPLRCDTHPSQRGGAGGLGPGPRPARASADTWRHGRARRTAPRGRRPAQPRRTATARHCGRAREPRTRSAAGGACRRRAGGLGSAVRPVAALHGQGPLTEALADGLRAAGVDIRRSDGREPVRRGAGADVVVLTDCLVVDPCVVSELVGAGSPHLPVLLRDGVGMVGPLVLPGRSSCLRCADLHRSDRDPEWPALAAQLFGRVGYGSAAAVRATAGLALGEVEHLLRGGAGGEPAPGSLGATLELDLRHGTLRRRPWPPHPRCGCGTHR